MTEKNNVRTTNKTKLPEISLDIPGKFDTEIGRMTAEAIRASGLKVASDLLEVAAQARSTAEAISDEANEIATSIGEATGSLADRIESYVASCKAAADSFRQHREALANLPSLPTLMDGLQVKVVSSETFAEIQSNIAAKIIADTNSSGAA